MRQSLYLIPTFLGHHDSDFVSPRNKSILAGLRHFVVENEKAARQFLKSVLPDIKQAEFRITELDKHAPEKDITAHLKPFGEGLSVGLMSEAGLPCMADPGNVVVQAARKMGCRIVPLGGLSAVFMAIMASGFNGQQFVFHGYLPIDSKARTIKIKELEKLSAGGTTQVFIETPYRNARLFDELMRALRNETLMCIAAGISCPEEFIETKTTGQWKLSPPDFQKIPAVFLLGVY
jgi:16S rRNA (cytidine1402-2'-O)-methyltransferase